MSDDLNRRLAALEADHADLRELAISGLWHTLDRIYALAGDDLKPACPACGKARGLRSYGRRTDRDMFGGGELNRLACPACECVFGPLAAIYAPTEFIGADYRLLYARYSESDSTDDEVRAFEALNPRKDGLYLNWGAGQWSRSVEVLRERGYDVWGYEPYGREARPFTVTNRAEISAQFDGIFSNNVIEHLLRPADEFRDMATCLKPDGAMAHASPCYAWSYADTRFHVFFPLGKSPEALAARTGFKVTARIDDGPFRARIFSRA